MTTQKKILLVAFALLIVGANMGVIAWRKSKMVQFDLHELELARLDQETDIRSMQFAPDGSLWFINYRERLVTTDKQGVTIKEYTSDDIGIEPRQFLIDSQGKVVVEGFYTVPRPNSLLDKEVIWQGISVFDGTNWQVVIKDEDRNLSLQAIDSDGRIWVTRDDGNGIWVLEDSDSPISYSTKNSGLPDDDVRVIAFDKEGRAWIGTSKGGLTIFNGKDWVVYNTGNSLIHDNHIDGIFFDNQNRGWLTKLGSWVNGYDQPNGSISVFDGKNWTIYTPENSDLPGGGVSEVVFDDENRALIQGSLRLGISDKGTFSYFYFGSSIPFVFGYHVRRIEVDNMNNFWVMMSDAGSGPVNKIAILPSNFASTSPTTTEAELRQMESSLEPQIISTILLLDIWLLFAVIKWRRMGIGIAVALATSLGLGASTFFGVSIFIAAFLAMGIVLGGLNGPSQPKRGIENANVRGMVIGGAICFVLLLVFPIIFAPQ